MADEGPTNLWAMLNPDPKRRADELARWMRNLGADSDRAVAQAAASFLGDKLGRIVRKSFSILTGEVDELLGTEEGGEGPLAAMSQRALLCQCLGIISKGAASQLHLLHRLRARFAHRQEGATFEGDTRIKAILSGLRWMTGPGFAAPESDRERIIHAAVDLHLYLDAIEKAIRPMTYWPNSYDSVFMDEATRAREIERVMKLQKGAKDGPESKGRLWF